MSTSIERTVAGGPNGAEASRGHESLPFHLSLNVADLGRSVEFFSRLFNVEPAKLRDDYAKFEVANPPLVLSLEPFEAGGAPVNHLGIRLPDSEQLVELQRRLESDGIACQREEGVACCYSRQTKFWVTDPDRNLWELYSVEEDLDCRGVGQLPVVERAPPPSRRDAAPAIWVHRLGELIAERLFVETGSVDEVLLQGSFNATWTAGERRHLLAEVQRILKPGGQVTVHGLSADRQIADCAGRLPGPAAAVTSVPTADQLFAELEDAGFEALQFTKLDESACFTLDGVGLRETRLVGYRPAEAAEPATHAALYKGPFRSLEDDQHRVLLRGRWTPIDQRTFNRLQASAQAGQFLFRPY